MALIGFIAAFIFMAIGTLSTVFLMMFGGEEFSPVRGKSAIVMLIGLAALVWGWWALFSQAPFTIQWR